MVVVKFIRDTYQVCTLGSVIMTELCVNMRVRPMTATFLSL